MNPLKLWSYAITVWIALAVWPFFTGIAHGQDAAIEALKRQVAEMQAQMQKLIERIEQMEREKPPAVKVSEMEKSVRAVQTAPSLLNPAMGFLIDATAEHREKVGGDFNFRRFEVGLFGAVDPFARAFATIGAGKDEIEIEEAAIVTTSLPWNLTAQGGRFFSDFGRLPKFHQDQLPFANFPLSIERMVGGESRADGVQLSYLFPTPFFLRATLGGFNKIGEENDRVDDDKARAWSRFTYLGRLHTYYDLTDNYSIELGSSLAYTPSVRIPGDDFGSDRTLAGIDLTFRYQPLAATLYQGFTVGSEFYLNNERVERASGLFRRQRAVGGYGYGEIKLNRNWSTGFLFDYAPSLESPGKKTKGYSPFLTWNLSEFNRLRFQYSFFDDHVREDPAERGHQFFVQWTTVLGPHFHGFRAR